MKATLEQIEKYLFNPEEIYECQEAVDLVANEIGPLLLRESFLNVEQIQYFQDEIDWVATLNDVLEFCNDEELEQVFSIIKNNV